jgi:hypothetical protein
VKPASLATRLRLLLACGTVLVLGVVAATTYRSVRAAYFGQLDRILEVMAVGVAAVASAATPATDLESEVSAIVTSPWRGPGNEVRVWLDGETTDVVSTHTGPSKELVLGDASSHA